MLLAAFAAFAQDGGGTDLRLIPRDLTRGRYVSAVVDGGDEPADRGCAGRYADDDGNPVMDSMELGRTEITGNQELPKVLYIVPWQKSDPGDLMGKPVNTLLDEVLAPLDREEFLRQVDYYDDLYGKMNKSRSALARECLSGQAAKLFLEEQDKWAQ